jgi:hypothetical protein
MSFSETNLVSVHMWSDASGARANRAEGAMPAPSENGPRFGSGADR